MSEYKQPKNIIYTESVNYPDDLPEPIQDRPWYRRWARRLIAFVFVLATFFLFGGIYQLGLVQQTPTDTPAGNYEKLVDQPTRTIPVTVYVLTEDEGNQTDVANLVTKTNAILKQVGVSLSLERTETVRVEDLPENDRQIAGTPTALREQLPDLNSEQLNVVVTEGLTGLNGVAFVGRDVVAVAEYNATFDFRVLAHEVGHILSLTHTTDRRNLMRSGGSGVLLNMSQAQQAYETAKRFTVGT